MEGAGLQAIPVRVMDCSAMVRKPVMKKTMSVYRTKIPAHRASSVMKTLIPARRNQNVKLMQIAVMGFFVTVRKSVIKMGSASQVAVTPARMMGCSAMVTKAVMRKMIPVYIREIPVFYLNYVTRRFVYAKSRHYR
jgi:hypothetical protein